MNRGNALRRDEFENRAVQFDVGLECTECDQRDLLELVVQLQKAQSGFIQTEHDTTKIHINVFADQLYAVQTRFGTSFVYLESIFQTFAILQKRHRRIVLAGTLLLHCYLFKIDIEYPDIVTV